MNRRALIVFTGLIAAAVFAGGATFFYANKPKDAPAVAAVSQSAELVRPHSAIMGPQSAPVTIVEFFDPSCEACRAFYPFVKQQLMETYPQDVRVVLRYAPFHPASQEAVRILEAARKQDKFQRVLENLLLRQEDWGADGNPKPEVAWAVAEEMGLDIAQAKKDAFTPEVDQVLKTDMADLQAANVQGTPTFFVNGKPLPSFGKQQLADLVKSEVEASRTQ
ncbi:MAG: thioredoxin domain-containing protein [Methylobacterium mesophilicum]|nr:thioredoxin domain-containing protein [Methylobacterium mesophilicum]